MVVRKAWECILLLVYFITVASATPTKVVAEKESSQLTDTATPQLVISSNTKIHSRQGYDLLVRGMSCTCDLNIAESRRRDDYQYTPGIGAHKFHGRSATFNEARKICHSEGGHLAIIDSDAEERILLDLLTRSGPILGISWTGGAWVGIHDLYAEGEWVTIFNDPIDARGYNRWFGSNPDNAGGKENCGNLVYTNGSGKLNDLPCGNKQPFWCEIPDVQIV